MTVLERVETDFKTAMKSKDELALSVMRLVRSALKNKQIELGRDLKDEDTHAVLKTMIKQYQDALTDFQAAGRQDLLERQQKEIDLIAQYLPPSLPAEELEKIVSEAVKSSGATDMGKAMGAAMKAVAGRADGNEVRAIVQRQLSG
ncbi:GatB/YqeY domain-containing protein [Candidatus Uhrbacteria bacterium]|nr:MAG: GatB/YqeY domain-containing protein [Candidatus Uhrbacteria bacterium]